MLRRVTTKYGILEGIPSADPRVTIFKGVPFAKPPVGENRWRAPQPMEPWEGVREAIKFAPISVQDTPGLGDTIYNKEWAVDPEIPMDEDCLYLNVWTPANRVDEKLPVLVWFFGGGFQWGNTQEMEFDGERLARRGIIVVSVNYRLAALGFLAHPEITRQQPDAPANFGSLDQKAGLHWVYENIEAFGGDPEKITIAGQSAGGASVMSQMACKDNAHIIKGAVVMSGMIRDPYHFDNIIVPVSLETAEKWGEEFFAYMGVSTLDEARALDPYFIREKYAEFANFHPRFSLLIDGQFIEEDPFTAYLEGRSVNVPVMSGNTSDEFFTDLEAGSEEELKEKAKEIFGEKTDAFLAREEVQTVTDGHYGKMSVIEYSVKAAFRKRSRFLTNKPGYYYCFDPDIPGEDNPGTFHSVDLWFFFESLQKCWRPMVGRHFDLARQMCNYFANFVKYGDPNGVDADGTEMAKWKPYTGDDRSEMIFTSQGPVTKMDDNELVDFCVSALHDKGHKI